MFYALTESQVASRKVDFFAYVGRYYYRLLGYSMHNKVYAKQAYIFWTVFCCLIHFFRQCFCWSCIEYLCFVTQMYGEERKSKKRSQSQLVLYFVSNKSSQCITLQMWCDYAIPAKKKHFLQQQYNIFRMRRVMRYKETTILHQLSLFGMCGVVIPRNKGIKFAWEMGQKRTLQIFSFQKFFIAGCSLLFRKFEES